MYILPYKTASKSAKKLAHELGAILLGDILVLNKGDPSIRVINWGKGNIASNDPVLKCSIINKPNAIKLAINKYATLVKLMNAGVPVPEFTLDKNVAKDWSFAGKIVARKCLEGKDGEGVTIVNQGCIVPDAKMYAKFIPAKAEYRISVCRKLNGDYTAFAVQKKVPITENYTPDVKTTAGGFGLKLLEEQDIPKGIRPVARDAVKALDLDFGGVDLILGTNGKPYVLEVNTAPELTDTLVKRYAKHLKELVN